MLRIGQDFEKGFQNVWHLLYEGSVFIIQEWATGVPRSTLSGGPVCCKQLGPFIGGRHVIATLGQQTTYKWPGQV